MRQECLYVGSRAMAMGKRPVQVFERERVEALKAWLDAGGRVVDAVRGHPDLSP